MKREIEEQRRSLRLQTFMEKKRIERLEKIGYFNTICNEKQDSITELTNQLLRRTPAILATESPSIFNDDEMINSKDLNRRMNENSGLSAEFQTTVTKCASELVDQDRFYKSYLSVLK